MPNLNIVICPGCGSRVALENRGCPDCGYENNDDGRLLSIEEILKRPSYPLSGATRLNDVSPAFIQAVVDAAANTHLSGKNHGSALELQGRAGERIRVVAVDVEGQFIGLSITESKGLKTRRLGAELANLDDIQALRDTLSAFLSRSGRY